MKIIYFFYTLEMLIIINLMNWSEFVLVQLSCFIDPCILGFWSLRQQITSWEIKFQLKKKTALSMS
jgi:hypothetical protein